MENLSERLSRADVLISQLEGQIRLKDLQIQALANEIDILRGVIARMAKTRLDPERIHTTAADMDKAIDILRSYDRKPRH